MKTSQTKPVCFLFLGLIIYALFNAAQAGTQPSVTVQSYAKHVGNNTVYTYQVTNHGPDRLFDFHIGCICTNADDTNSEPQLVIYPVDYDFDYGELGRTSKGSYSAPAGWYGLVAHYEDVGYISFKFSTKSGSGISLLPGYTETFSITTRTIDDSGIISLYASGGVEGEAFFYDLNRRGYLTGHYSYAEDDDTGKYRVVSYPMQLIDQAPPTLSVTLTPAILWPPNNKLVAVTAAITVTDDYDPEPEIKLESITSNETLAGGDIQNAQIGTDDRSFSLAAEREGGNLAGRVYTVTYSATDASGNKATASATTTVPHDQGK